MKTMTSEYRDRVRHWLRVLKDDLYTPLGEISFEAARTMDELSYEDSAKLNYTKVAPGFTWGNTWEYCWFRGEITIPECAQGERICLDLQPGGESTLFVDDVSFGTYRASWVKYPLQYIEDNFITTSAEAGRTYKIVMETYAGHYYPEAPSGGCATGPVLPGSYEEPVPDNDARVLGNCTYGIWNETAYQLLMDAECLNSLYESLDPNSLRAAKVAEALEKFTLVCDFEQDREGRIASYIAAREALRPAMEATNGSSAPEFYAIGNAHLDLAWLWPMAETYRKTSRTFAAQLRLLKEYPEYKYLQSQPAAYDMCKKYYPELFERIKEAIKDGQWIAEGAMWVEPDTNMAGGEALVRQLLYGMKYYEEELGVKSQVLWLPDTFGYAGALPQILKKSGVKYLVTQKIFWSYNEGERFPYHYFTWEGVDGSKVTAFLPTSYTYQTDPAAMNEVWNNRTQARDLDAFMIPFGYGDGGGGPARDHIEHLIREKNLEGAPKVTMMGPVEMFEKMEENGGPANTYSGELYFDAHRGTYTSQAKIKKNNRKAELALREMEIWGAAAGLKGVEYDLNENEKLWKELLLHQFHDILPGSGIKRIYDEADARVKAVIASAEDHAAQYATKVTDGKEGVTVFNSLSFERSGLVVLPEAYKNGAVTKDGKEVMTEEIDGQIVAFVTVPSVGAVTLLPAETKVEDGAKITVTDDGFVMENSVLVAKLNKNAEIVSYVLKESGREFAAEPMNRFHLYKDVPRLFDAWDIDSHYIKQELPGAQNIKVEVKKASGLEVVLKVTGEISESTYEQEITLAKGAKRIEFRTTVDWKELHRLLKVSFPVTVYANSAINEMQFGYVERPNKRSRQYEKDRFEVCNHRYSALVDGSHGAAVLNDCKYGISVNENALELTLLRAAAAPEMRADNYVHEFTYAFTAFEGCFVESDVTEQGLDLNVPMMTAAGAVDTFSLVDIDQKNIVLEAMKTAEDGSGDVILRLYEAKKAPVKAVIKTAFTGKAWLCDMRENKEQEIENKDGVLTLDFNAFEILTVRIAK